MEESYEETFGETIHSLPFSWYTFCTLHTWEVHKSFISICNNLDLISTFSYFRNLQWRRLEKNHYNASFHYNSSNSRILRIRSFGIFI